jgi:Fis family transcriptional regulator
MSSNNAYQPQDNPRTIRESVAEALEEYFDHLDGQPVTDLYELVIAEVEAPLLETVLKVTGNNQSQCARLLGLNRGTLRKKLKKYGLL